MRALLHALALLPQTSYSPTMSIVLETEESVTSLPESDFQAFAAGVVVQTVASRVDEAFEKAILSGQFDKIAIRALRHYQTEAKPV